MNTEPRVTLFATLTPHADQIEKTQQIMSDLAAASRQEAGCLFYNVFRGEQDGQVTIHVVERYRNAAALQAHISSQHFLALKARMSEILSRHLEVYRLQDIDVIGE